MLRNIKILLILANLIVGNIYAQYYVKSASELNGILSNLVPGDTIVMANGTWTNQQIILDAFGSENDSIVLMAETAGHVILTGTSTLRIRGKYLKVDGLRFENGFSSDDGVIEFRRGSSKAYNSRLTNTSVVNYNPESKSSGYKWVSIYGKNNRVDHCYFENKMNDGALLVVWMPDSGEEVFHRIDHNYFGKREPLGYNGGETIRIGTSSYSLHDASCTVEYNYFEECDGEAEIISNKTGNNTFRYNTFYECDGTLTFRHGEKSYAYGNFFFGNNKPGTGGIRLVGPHHEIYNNYFVDLAGGDNDWNAALTMMNGIGPEPINGYTQVDSVTIVNNTFVNCKNTFLIGAVNSSYSSTMVLPPSNSVIANNIVKSSQQIFKIENMFENMTFEGNIMSGGSLGIEQPSGITITDPMLVLGTDSLWRINDSSPAYNAGVGLYDMVLDDMDGQLRDSNKDIGSDEFSSDPVKIIPRNKNNSGPSWLGTNVPVSLSIEINGGGKVELNPSGGAYELGTQVQITAIPNDGSTFENWSGDTTSTDNPITIIVNKPWHIIANFNDPKFYTYNLFISGSGKVDVTPDLSEYPEGLEVEFNAIPSDGWIFSKWNGSLTGNKNPDTLIFDSNENVQAIFEIATDVKDEDLQYDYHLDQNYPNPFNPSTIIKYSIKKSTQTRITIVNILGKVVDTLVDEIKQKGNYQINYNASKLTSGIYFINFKAGHFNDTKKMVLNR